MKKIKDENLFKFYAVRYSKLSKSFPRVLEAGVNGVSVELENEENYIVPGFIIENIQNSYVLFHVNPESSKQVGKTSKKSPALDFEKLPDEYQNMSGVKTLHAGGWKKLAEDDRDSLFWGLKLPNENMQLDYAFMRGEGPVSPLEQLEKANARIAELESGSAEDKAQAQIVAALARIEELENEKKASTVKRGAKATE